MPGQRKPADPASLKWRRIRIPLLPRVVHWLACFAWKKKTHETKNLRVEAGAYRLGGTRFLLASKVARLTLEVNEEAHALTFEA